MPPSVLSAAAYARRARPRISSPAQASQVERVVARSVVEALATLPVTRAVPPPPPPPPPPQPTVVAAISRPATVTIRQRPPSSFTTSSDLVGARRPRQA